MAALRGQVTGRFLIKPWLFAFVYDQGPNAIQFFFCQTPFYGSGFLVRIRQRCPEV